jgi:hypothetical protein
LVFAGFCVSFFAFDNVSDVEAALAAFFVAGQTVFVEGVAAHEVDRGECESVLAVGAVVRQEGFRCGLEFLVFESALFGFLHVLLHGLFVFFDVVLVLLEST